MEISYYYLPRSQIMRTGVTHVFPLKQPQLRLWNWETLKHFKKFNAISKYYQVIRTTRAVIRNETCTITRARISINKVPLKRSIEFCIPFK